MMTDFDISQIRAEALIRLSLSHFSAYLRRQGDGRADSLSHVSTQWMIDWPDIDVLAITRDIARGG